MNAEDISSFLSKHPVSVVYFSHENCSVCKVLKPKIISMVHTDFPESGFRYVDIKENPEAAAQNSIFTAPAIIVYIRNSEYKRFIRVFGVSEVNAAIEKAFQIINS